MSVRKIIDKKKIIPPLSESDQLALVTDRLISIVDELIIIVKREKLKRDEFVSRLSKIKVPTK